MKLFSVQMKDSRMTQHYKTHKSLFHFSYTNARLTRNKPYFLRELQKGNTETWTEGYKKSLNIQDQTPCVLILIALEKDQCCVLYLSLLIFRVVLVTDREHKITQLLFQRAYTSFFHRIYG